MGLILKAEKYLGMASGELTLTEVALDLPVKREQANQVSDARTRLA